MQLKKFETCYGHIFGSKKKKNLYIHNYKAYFRTKGQL